MTVEIRKPTSEQVAATSFVDTAIKIYLEGRPADQALAEVLTTKGAGMMAIVVGRREAALLLRGLAEHLEGAEEFSGG